MRNCWKWAEISMRLGKLRIVGLALICLIAIGLELRHLRVSPVPRTARVARFTPDFALLPGSEAIAYAKLFGENSKTKVESWEPTVADIEGLETNLPQISALKESSSGPSRHIDDPHRYRRQYLAIVQDGRPRIFVNALCKIDADDSNTWRKHLELASDGGTCFWQALYDPSTQRFSNLMINGVG
jgi:hypothetical protein